MSAPFWFQLQAGIDGPQQQAINQQYAIIAGSESLKEIAACQHELLENKLELARQAAPSYLVTHENNYHASQDISASIDQLQEIFSASSAQELEALYNISDTLTAGFLSIGGELKETKKELKKIGQQTEQILSGLASIYESIEHGNQILLQGFIELVYCHTEELSQLNRISREVNQQYHQRLRDIKVLAKIRLHMGIRNTDPENQKTDYQDALASFQDVVSDPLGRYDSECWFNIGWLEWKLNNSVDKALISFQSSHRYCNKEPGHYAHQLIDDDPLFYISIRHAAHMCYLADNFQKAFELLDSVKPDRHTDLELDFWWEYFRYAALAGKGADIKELLVKVIVERDPSRIFLLLSDPDFRQTDSYFPLEVGRSITDHYLGEIKSVIAEAMMVIQHLAYLVGDYSDATQALDEYLNSTKKYISDLEESHVSQLFDLIEDVKETTWESLVQEAITVVQPIIIADLAAAQDKSTQLLLKAEKNQEKIIKAIPKEEEEKVRLISSLKEERKKLDEWLANYRELYFEEDKNRTHWLWKALHWLFCFSEVPPDYSWIKYNVAPYQTEFDVKAPAIDKQITDQENALERLRAYLISMNKSLIKTRQMKAEITTEYEASINYWKWLTPQKVRRDQ